MAEVEYSETLEIRASPAIVWKGITNGDSIAKYHLAPLKTMELHPNGRIAYGTPDQDLIIGRILKIEPGKYLEHTFQFKSNSHAGTVGDPETIVRYSLKESPTGTSLTLKHSGFVEENQTYANIKDGWPFILEGLKNFAEKNPL